MLRERSPVATPFDQMQPFCPYAVLVAALGAYPRFAAAGGDTAARRDAAAFPANISHETGGPVHVVEQNTADHPHHCDTTQPDGRPVGTAADVRTRPDPPELERRPPRATRRASTS